VTLSAGGGAGYSVATTPRSASEFNTSWGWWAAGGVVSTEDPSRAFLKTIATGGLIF
jgi:hypothetical protein